MNSLSFHNHFYWRMAFLLSLKCYFSAWGGGYSVYIMTAENLPSSSSWSHQPTDLVTGEELQIVTSISVSGRFMISVQFDDAEMGDYINVQTDDAYYNYLTPGNYTVNLTFSTTTESLQWEMNINAAMYRGIAVQFDLMATNQSIGQEAQLQLVAIFIGNFTCLLDFDDGKSTEFEITDSTREYNLTHIYGRETGVYSPDITCTATAKIATAYTSIYISPNQFNITSDTDYIFIEGGIGFELSGTITYTTNVNMYMYDEDGNQLYGPLATYSGNRWTFSLPSGVIAFQEESHVYLLFSDTVFETGVWISVYQALAISGTSFQETVLEEPLLYSFHFSATAGTFVRAAIDFGDGVVSDEPCYYEDCSGHTFSMTCQHRYPVVWPQSSYTVTLYAINNVGDFETSLAITVTMPPTTMHPAFRSISELEISLQQGLGQTPYTLEFLYHVPPEFETPVNTTCDILDVNGTIKDSVELVLVDGNMLRTIPISPGPLRWAVLVQYWVNCYNSATTVTLNAITWLYDEVTSLSASVEPSRVDRGEQVAILFIVSQGSNVTYDVNFGDGNITSGIEPTNEYYNSTIYHTYADRGEYTISIHASNDWSSQDQSLTVRIYSPVTSLSTEVSPAFGEVNDPVAITATIITGSDVFYDFNFGDGTELYGEEPPIESTPITVFHTYSSLGNYHLLVVARNQWSSINQSTLVSIYFPVTELQVSGVPNVILVNQNFTFDISVEDGTNVRFDVYFGDVTETLDVEPEGSQKTVSMFHAYNTSGEFEVFVLAWNPWSSMNYSSTIIVWAPNYSLKLSVHSPEDLPALSSVYFTIALDYGIQQDFLMDFGDGETSSMLSTDSRVVNISHTYMDAGPKTVNAQAESEGVEIYDTIHVTIFEANRPNISVFTCAVGHLHYIEYDIRMSQVNFSILTDGWYSLNSLPGYHIDIDYGDSISLNSSLDSFHYLHEYVVAGTYEITMVISDLLYSGRIRYNTSIVVTYQCLPPIMFGLPQYTDAKTPLTHSVSSAFSLSIQVLLQCEYSSHQFLWQFTDTYGNTRSENTTSPRILIDARSMSLGLYQVNLTVSVIGRASNYSDSLSLYLEINQPPIVASLSGGDRALGTGQTGLLDASNSYDPLEIGNILTYIWKCTVVDRNFATTDVYTIPIDSSCTSLLAPAPNTPAVLNVDGSLLESGLTYLFQVTVESEDGRSDTAQQLLVMVEGVIPAIGLR